MYVAPAGRNPGILLIYRDGNVLAQRFDEEQQKLLGDLVTLVPQVGAFVASAFFTASRDLLVYRSGIATMYGRLQWWDREGRYVSNPEQPTGVRTVALSPNGQQAALTRRDPVSSRTDILTWDTNRNNSTRVTFDPREVAFPVWSPDGTHIVFASNRDGAWNLYRKRADESKEDEVLLTSGQDKSPTSISADGQLLLYTQTDPQTSKTNVWVLRNLDGRPENRRAVPVLTGEFNESEARFSPAPGKPRWIAYTSDETGRNEVYVRELSEDGIGPTWPASRAGGSNPRWRGDGKELFFAALDGTVMSIDVTPGALPSPRITVPSGILPNWDVTADGKKFLLLLQQDAQAPFSVLQNWQALLK